MKKFLVSLLVAGLVMFSSVALASQGEPGWYEQKNNPSVIHYFKNGYNGQGFLWMDVQPTEIPTGTADVISIASGTAIDTDSSSSTSSYGNDFGDSGGYGWVSGFNESTASAEGGHCEIQWVQTGRMWYQGHFEFVQVPNEATVTSYLFGHSPDVDAWSFAMDFGTTSIAGAGAEVEGDRCDILVGGSGFGLEGDLETSFTEVGIGGYIWQENSAAEEGYYNGTFANGGNGSEAGFVAYNSTYDEGQSCSFLFWDFDGASTHLHGIEGNAIVKGCTFVSVDPYGDHRSAYATTHNSAEINFPGVDYVAGYVGGGGGVAAAAVNGGTYAGGSAVFNYNGLSNGSGQATVNAQIHTGSSGSNISVVSSATAVAE